jgi:cytochrome c peroxidase
VGAGRARLLRLAAAAAGLMLASAGSAEPPIPPEAPPALSARAQLGRQLFFDPGLSVSGRQSCASCHDPAHAYAPGNARAVQLGGARLDTPGTRAVPSLMYKRWTQPYSDAYENPDLASPPAPGGGFGWDGRADTLAQQAAIPLLAPNEMGNASRAELAARLARTAYAGQLRALFGADVFADAGQVVDATGLALQAFQMEDRSFRPYSSKFDRYRNNKRGGRLSAQELRGLALYLRADRGNCNACHLLGAGSGGSQDVTTDYSYAALGVPRNPEIPANRDPRYHDLGLCGPLREDHRPANAGAASPYCGLFKVPVLRNAATRQVFMHNGRFKSLREVLRFYATRDTAPQRWYPLDTHGRVQKFDDLPAAYRANLDAQAPLDGRARGARPALSEAQIDDLLAFLQTLTDGYAPAKPAASGTAANAAKAHGP